jgi:hypothetical protein
MTETAPESTAEATGPNAVVQDFSTPIYDALVRDRNGRLPGVPATPPPLALEKPQGARRIAPPAWVTDGGRRPRSGARRPRKAA